MDDFAAIARVESVLQRILPAISDAELKPKSSARSGRSPPWRGGTEGGAGTGETEEVTQRPRGHFAVGVYLCFLRGQWEEGLPELAKSNDGALRDIALAELAQPKAVEGICKLAERWLAEAPSAPASSRANIMQHAADLYRSAKAAATGLQAALIERKLVAIPQASRTRRINLLDLFDAATSVRQGKWQLEDRDPVRSGRLGACAVRLYTARRI